LRPINSKGENNCMSMLYAAGKWGSILVLIALLITLVKQLIAFVGFITGAIKLLIILAFVALIIFVGYLVLKNYTNNRRRGES
ncbi:hypothetical protein, partial [Vibrio alginolyticus]|uniref:hypothetical protein n=1 Tax=Vibrio alginolyticus TaxID=663 RepID=UPI001A9044BB